MISRTDKMERELKRIIGMFINETSNRKSLITIIHCDVSPDMKYATIFISVLPMEQEKTAVAFLNRLKNEARKYLSERLRTRTIPSIKFDIDPGERHRQHIEELSSKIKV